MNFTKTKHLLGLFFLILLAGTWTASSEAQDGDRTFRVSEIMDSDVYDKNQNIIGEVDDLIFRRSGKVKNIIVEFGGFYDIGDKLVALPFKKARMENGKCILDVTERELDKKSEFNYFNRGLRPGYYYRTGPYGAPYYRYPPRGYSYGPSYQRPPVNFDEMAFSPGRYLASVVTYRRMINENGRDIGRIVDLVIDRTSQKIQEIILLTRNVFPEEEHVALDYEPLGFSVYGLVYDISLDEFRSLPKIPYE